MPVFTYLAVNLVSVIALIAAAFLHYKDRPDWWWFLLFSLGTFVGSAALRGDAVG